jgi:ABC-type sugar transport system permease subunit
MLFCAGLQAVPRDPLEAAIVDGADAWQRLRQAIRAHLAPLVALITLIHVMEVHRAFEPILVLGRAVLATSRQHLAHCRPALQDDTYRAAACAILTMIGAILLPMPMPIRRRHEHRAG